MPTETVDPQFFGPGISVEMGKIQRELKKLWQQSDQVATRASRLNLVIYNSGENSIRANTALVEKIARQHAFRAILIAAKPQLPGNHVRAWVNAHCQIDKKGAKQRCSEQIAFELTGEARQQGLTPNLVLGHVDGDLPLFLWRQGEFAHPSEQLLAWVDRLIFDSADWPHPGAQFSALHLISESSGLEPEALADLNWTRLSGLRTAIAQFFDAPGACASVQGLETVEISHEPGIGVRMRALLLAGWLAAQLDWQAIAGKAEDDVLHFQGAAGKIKVQFKPDGDPGTGIRKVAMRGSDGAKFGVSREAKSNFFNATAHCPKDAHEHLQLLPVGPEEMADLVSAELLNVKGTSTFSRALAKVESALAA